MKIKRKQGKKKIKITKKQNQTNPIIINNIDDNLINKYIINNNIIDNNSGSNKRIITCILPEENPKSENKTIAD